MTAKEAASAWHVSTIWVLKKCEAGAIPGAVKRKFNSRGKWDIPPQDKPNFERKPYAWKKLRYGK